MFKGMFRKADVLPRMQENASELLEFQIFFSHFFGGREMPFSQNPLEKDKPSGPLTIGLSYNVDTDLITIASNQSADKHTYLLTPSVNIYSG